MILLNSFLHREQLLNIAHRWFYDVLEPDDMGNLKRLINYNNLWVHRVGTEFACWMFESMTRQKVLPRQAGMKGDLKDLLVRHPPYRTPRIQTLIRRYLDHPERYFRETPFLGTLYTIEVGQRPLYIGSSRIKRVRRIAEKGARHLSKYITEQIEHRAERLVEQRASALGVAKETIRQSREELFDEYERAERRIAQEIRRGLLYSRNLKFELNDVLGVKAVVEEHDQPRLLHLLESNPRCQLMEIEHHRGRYNATNIVFRYQPSLETLLERPLGEEALKILEQRGMKREAVNDEFREFVLSGEDSIHIELIVCDFQELLESEIGASMHEDRIVRQRRETSYRGHLARNTSYLMEFMFACGISPRTTLDEIPIKLWTPYMPDYFDEVLKQLFDIPTFGQIEGP
jgi:hypothetical protein